MPRLIDLSHPLVHGQLGFPGDPGLSVTVAGTIAEMGYNLTKLSMSTHQGTHLDVPYHFFDDGKTVDQMPLERFFGPATLIDLAPNGVLAPKTPISVSMLLPHEDKLQPGARVIYRTGWHRHYNTPEFFTDYPTLAVEAAHWIAEHRIVLLGMDTGTPSVDFRECHWALLDKRVEMVIVEGLANLDQLPERFTFVGFPLNIAGRDGSPIRAVAVVDEEN
jgi:kynurenine formamidase